jgi:hypothetical protein
MEHALRNGFITQEDLSNTVKIQLMNYIQNIYNQSEVMFLKNKLAQVLVLCMVELYQSAWPSFFQDLLLLPHRNLLLLVLHAFDGEVISPYVQRSNEMHTKHTLVKDRMRDTDVPSVINFLTMVIRDGQNPVDSNLAIQLIGLYSGTVTFYF